MRFYKKKRETVLYFQKDCAILTVTHWRTAPLLRGRVSTAEEKENCFLESREMRWIFQRLYKWNLLRSLNPGRIVVASFAIIILVGALLLMLPISSRDGQVTDFISCLFTATSATCVTGLIVVDTYMHWTLFGQVVIICLIQLGGLGFMTLISVISFLLRRRIGLSERLLMASTLNLNDMDGVVRVVRHALMGTFLLEGIGAAILALRFIPDFGLLKGIWRGIFHSISAFCNAGFDILGVDQPFVSLTNYNDDPVILLVIMSLIVIGGLGFFVWEDILRCRKDLRKLSLYSKMVLCMTAALIIGGTLFFLAVEWHNPATLGDMPVWQKVVNSMFQAITLRTAGYDSVGQAGLLDSSLVMGCILMLIGGSSGSTAGGIKTGTIAVLLLTLRAGLVGREAVTFRGRTIAQRRVMDAMTLALVVVGVCVAGSMVLSLLESVHFLDAAYEVASAMATVGVTVGITPGLGNVARVMLVIMMYLGRVGIMSFSIAFLSRSKDQAKIKYPTAEVMIG